MRKTILIIFFLSLFCIPAVEGEEYISDPSRVPLVGDFNTPSSLKHGETGAFYFTVKNSYENNIQNMTLIVEIYEYASKDKNKSIDEVQNPPNLDGDRTFAYEIKYLESGIVKIITVPITTYSGTLAGVYLIRLYLNFIYDNTSYIMKSRGYFSEEDWEIATRSLDSGIEAQFYVGNINISYLEVDGVIPETSFGVEFEKDPSSFILWGLIVGALSTFIVSLIVGLLIKNEIIKLQKMDFRNLFLIIFTCCVIASFLVSWVLWSSSPSQKIDTNYNAAMFVRYKTTGSIITNDLRLANNISTISGRLGFTDYENEMDWVRILGEPPNDVPLYLIKKYELEFAIENKEYPEGYWAYDTIYYSRFYKSLPNERYKIYENNDLNIWFVFNENNQ